MGKYDEYLGSALRERVDKMQLRAAATLSLQDERALLYEFVAQSCVRYAAVMEQTKDMAIEQKFRLQSIAASLVVDAIKEVTEITIAEHKITEVGRQVDISIVHNLVTQMVSMLEEELEVKYIDPEELISRYAERARTELLTVDAVAKTRITPETINDEIKELLATIPGPPPSHNLKVAGG